MALRQVVVRPDTPSPAKPASGSSASGSALQPPSCVGAACRASSTSPLRARLRAAWYFRPQFHRRTQGDKDLHLPVTWSPPELPVQGVSLHRVLRAKDRAETGALSVVGCLHRFSSSLSSLALGQGTRCVDFDLRHASAAPRSSESTVRLTWRGFLGLLGGSPSGRGRPCVLVEYARLAFPDSGTVGE